jgi:hypothetical protein
LTFYTYLWLREDGSPYYVGKGCGNRVNISNRGHRPPKDYSRIRVQEWSDEATAFAYERYFIDFWGRKDLGTGCLRNLTDGGEGGSGRKRSQEECRGISKRQLGRKLSSETRMKISGTLKGRQLSLEHRKSISKARIGVTCSSETKERIGAVHRGKVLSKETRARISAANLGRKLSAEVLLRRKA